MGARQKRPPIGTVMWDVHENRYYEKGSVLVRLEYVVTSAPIESYFEGGYVELVMCGPIPNGDYSSPTPRYHKLSDIGTKVFYTAREAALHAKELTEKYERTWGWTKDPPMRRTWEKYLEEQDGRTEENH